MYLDPSSIVIDPIILLLLHFTGDVEIKIGTHYFPDKSITVSLIVSIFL